MENSQAMRPDRTAAAMLPARDQAALRPMRAVRTSRVQRPTVSAAMAGSKTPLTTSMMLLASEHRPEGLVPRRARGRRMTSPSSAQSMTARLRPVRSSQAPMGPCASRPSQPLIVLIRPVVVGLQPCSGDQVDDDVGARPTADIGDQEVQPVERRGVKVLWAQSVPDAS